jgi:hypothetical protein
MIVGRAPCRSTSRAVAYSEMSSHSYAADGFQAFAAFASEGDKPNTNITAMTAGRIVFMGA